ncbi:M18 family aminopeptidase [Stackebrandtia nassauensis]|uniref:M18 family aminopeptidase n=1 Tax=Stackebrandtia nassauensis (strain DSM 44728 / CIP 108903 / NRRL B-16338 / NBRC 102104 / LLR-40K-21) TaxID=446470 RepID=D3Q711_STANL|nr:M18 family aminopeptidase [Stackebrandtia nassauensis]ADD40410.1 Aspartyl aminopeptidase [Stackebrandtia nassauensis DSM 44728]
MSVVFDRRHTDELMSFVSASPTSYHAVARTAKMLAAAGFTALSESEAWDDTSGGHYVIRDGAVIAWYVPETATATTGFRIMGAHTDSPHLRVKPIPDTGAEGWRQIAVEVYGGVPRDTWLDRDLGVSGRLVTRDGTQHLVTVNEPLLRVPRVAIHLDRKVNEGQILDAQSHMTPIWGLGEPEEGELIDFLADRASLDAEEITGWDLAVHDTQAPAYLGRERELLACPRLDNLSSVHAGAAALIAAAEEPGDHIAVLAAFDHEECGSESRSGAGGPFLETILRRILDARGADLQDTARAFADSVVMSSDTTHAVHPNYADRHEPGHMPVAGGGPVIKVNANLRYATDGPGRAIFAAACAKAGVASQTFVNNNALPCGTTIGPITAARLGITTVDIGMAILSMHASRELCAADDPGQLAAVLAAFATE